MLKEVSFVCLMAAAALLPFLPDGEAGGCGCPPLWTGFDENCYRFFTFKNISWMGAEMYCREFSIPCGQDSRRFMGHLVSIHSQEEYDFLVALYESVRNKRVTTTTATYIGLHDQGDENTFEWSDGSTVDYLAWAPDQPNNYHDEQDCVEFSNRFNYMWNDIKCEVDETFIVEAFICKLPKW